MKMKEGNNTERCRLCACEKNLSTFYNIFEENSSSDIELKITKLLPVVVMAWDSMPHKICHSCIVKLNYFDEFYEGCLKAERLLRTLCPITPNRHLQNHEPVLEILDSPVLDKAFLFSPKSHETFPVKPETPESRADSDSRMKLNRFIVNVLTSTDCIFTCRRCFRTFTKESSAVNHICVRLEDCEELRSAGNVQKKALPPLKIRLFSKKFGFFVCYLCQGQFKNKKDLCSHLKLHFLEEKWRERKYMMRRRRKKRMNEKSDKRRRLSRKKKKRNRETISHSETANDCDSLSPVIEEARDGPLSQPLQEEVEILEKEIEMTDEEVQEIIEPCATERAEEQEANVKEMQEEANVEEVQEEANVDEVQEEANVDEVQEEANLEEVQEEANVEVVQEETDVEEVQEEANVEVVQEETDVEEVQEEANVEVVQKQTDLAEVQEETNVEEVQECAVDKAEITVIEVVQKKSPTSFSSCVFCDKIFATNGALVAHQRKHLGCLGMDFKGRDQSHSSLSKEPNPTRSSSYYSFLCSICAMMFTNKKTLLEHERYHLVPFEPLG